MATATMMGTLTGCAPPVSQGGFDAPDSASKIYAIENAVRNNDTSELHSIVEQLDSDDPAVRLVAISALQRLTGKTLGYCHYASRTDREASVKRWAEECRRVDDTSNQDRIEPSPKDSPEHGG